MLQTFEDCPHCGREGLKRSHSSLYEMNGWLHVCKTTPSWNRKIAYEKFDAATYQNEIVQDDWEYLGSEVRANDYGSWYSDTN